MMTELYILLCKIKAQVTIDSKLTSLFLSDDHDYKLNEEDDTEAVNRSVKNNHSITKDCTKLKNLLHEKMSTKITTTHKRKLLKYLMAKWKRKANMYSQKSKWVCDDV